MGILNEGGSHYILEEHMEIPGKKEAKLNLFCLHAQDVTREETGL